MATLTSSYQYIGRSNAVGCPNGWSYYILLYAKTSGDITTGKHTVSIKMRMACKEDSSFYGWDTTAYAKADGVTAFSWSKQQVPNSTWGRSLTEGGYTYARWIDLREGTAVVNAGFGVAKQITIEGSWVMNDTYSKGWFPYQGIYATASVSVTLPMLASASTITSASDVELGNNCSVTWTPQAASFRYKLEFAIGTWSYTTEAIHPNRTSAYTYNGYAIPISVASQITTRTGTMTITLYTYFNSGATSQIGSADSKEITVTVPKTEETKPTISVTLSPVSTLEPPFDSMYIQGKSRVEATLNILTKYGADIKSSSVTVEGIVYKYPYISGYLSQAVTQTITGYVLDSRDYDGTGSSQITVIPYSRPYLQAVSGESNIVAARCDENGELDEKGTYLKIKAKLGYEKVIDNEVQYNYGKIQYRYKEAGAETYSSWQTILNTKTSTSTEVVTDPLLNGALSTTKTYQVQLKATDYIEESEPITISVASEDVFMHRPAGGRSMGLGGYSTGAGKLDVYWKTIARGGLSLFTEDGTEISAEKMLPLPRGHLGSGWNPNDIDNGVHEVRSYPLKDSMGNVLMENGVLIQLAATADGAMKIQMAFPTDTHTPVYRIKWDNLWTDWNTFKI